MDHSEAHSRSGQAVAGSVSGAELEVDRSSSGESQAKGPAVGAADAVPLSQFLLAGPERGGGMEAANTTTTAATHGRKRSSSLRQAAMAKMRERIVVPPPSVMTSTDALSLDEPLDDGPPHVDAAPNPSSKDEATLNSKSTLPPLDQIQRHAPASSASPTFSSAEGPYVSTTDDDEAVSLHYPPASSSNSSLNHSLADSAMSTTRRRPQRTEPRATPTASPPPTDPNMDDDWDHSETEWWGWVILAATWIVFVVVMGSCFGVWSWAWDVGETPYAPPDLEDDDTLPITGYYPALIVCTAVMSWVWVVVAWVGLKYFRHAKVVADDG
jgi:hypothetical protein